MTNKSIKMRKQIIALNDITDLELGDLQFHLQKDADVYASASDDYLYYSELKGHWFSNKFLANEPGEAIVSETGCTISWGDFHEMYFIDSCDKGIDGFIEKEFRSQDDPEHPINTDDDQTFFENEESIAHIDEQEQNLFGINPKAAKMEKEDFWGDFSGTKVQEPVIPEESELPQTFNAKSEADYWKERYFKLLIVLNTFTSEVTK